MLPTRAPMREKTQLNLFAIPLAPKMQHKMSGKWGRGSHAEDNALAFVQTVEGEAAPSQHHVQKRRKKQRGLEIVFDPQAHK